MSHSTVIVPADFQIPCVQVKCDNSFLVPDNTTQGKKVSAQSGSATVPGQRSTIVVQQPSVLAKQHAKLSERAPVRLSSAFEAATKPVSS